MIRSGLSLGTLAIIVSVTQLSQKATAVRLASDEDGLLHVGGGSIFADLTNVVGPSTAALGTKTCADPSVAAAPLVAAASPQSAGEGVAVDVPLHETSSSVVISLDYDGCGDIQGEQFDKAYGAYPDLLKLFRDEFYKMINNMIVGHSGATLMVGSNRQSPWYDYHIRYLQSNGPTGVMNIAGESCVKDHGVGYCLKDYAKLVEDSFKGISDNVAWSFDPLLLSDADHAEALYGQKINFPVLEPKAWKNLSDLELSEMGVKEAYSAMDKLKQVQRGAKQYNDNFEFKQERLFGKQVDFQYKIDMLKLQFKQVSAKNPRGQPVDFYFVDDRKDILDAVVEAVKSDALPVPENIRFHAVQYDWYGIASEGGKVTTFYHPEGYRTHFVKAYDPESKDVYLLMQYLLMQSKAADRIQRNARAFLGRKKWDQQRASCTKIQRVSRGVLARQQLKADGIERRDAATSIQNAVRMRMLRKRLSNGTSTGSQHGGIEPASEEVVPGLVSNQRADSGENLQSGSQSAAAAETGSEEQNQTAQDSAEEDNTSTPASSEAVEEAGRVSAEEGNNSTPASSEAVETLIEGNVQGSAGDKNTTNSDDVGAEDQTDETLDVGPSGACCSCTSA